MLFEQTGQIQASPETVWSVLVDVERWPEWTMSMSTVEHLGGGELREGSTVRIKQPRLPRLDWRVTTFEPMHSFMWTTSAMGVTTQADHVISSQTDGIVAVTLRITSTGLLSGVTSRLSAALTRRYLAMEADGLKRRCEDRSIPPPDA